MRVRGVLPLAACCLLAAVAVSAGSQPIAVSPGDPSKLALIESRCPMFSWGQVDGAGGYELVVYRIGEDHAGAEPVLRQSFAGSVYSWSPSLERCLEQGGQYAWSVRAEGPGGASAWSAPSLFEVAPGPSPAELARALVVVRDYLGARAEAAPGAEAGETAEARRPDQASRAETPAPRAAPPGTALSVEGNVDAGSFSGVGTALTALDPANLSPGTAAIDISGTAAVASDLVGTACVSQAELTFDPATQLELLAHALLANVHHAPTVDTNCHGAPCDGTSFTNLQWAALQNVPAGFDDNVDDACTLTVNANGSATLACAGGPTVSWYQLRGQQVAGGGYHTCALKTDGTVDCWGWNDHGQATPAAGTFSQVEGGQGHSCGVKTDGTVACWGSDLDGESTPPAGTFSQVAVGRSHSCGVKSDGTVGCWGDDDHGQATPPAGTFSQIAAGGDHGCGVKTDDKVACWGRNNHGQANPPVDTFSQVAAGFDHSCGVETDGTVACWGDDDFGQATPSAGTFSQVAAGRYHSCGVKTDGTVDCWGANSNGQIDVPSALQ